MLEEVWTDRWTPENPDAKYPRIGGAQLFIGSDITSDMLEDGSYTRLRAVTLTYNVPPAWTNAQSRPMVTRRQTARCLRRRARTSARLTT